MKQLPRQGVEKRSCGTQALGGEAAIGWGGLKPKPNTSMNAVGVVQNRRQVRLVLLLKQLLAATVADGRRIGSLVLEASVFVHSACSVTTSEVYEAPGSYERQAGGKRCVRTC